MPALMPHDVAAVCLWNLKSDLNLPCELGCLSLSLLLPFIGHSDIDHLEVRFRRGGERIKLPGSEITRTLKNCFNEWGVPPWQRDRVPLLYYQGEIVMVWGHTDFLWLNEEASSG